jgi:hypothetical protein
VVKEFVWRRGAGNDRFQLITLSKDRTLRFWPIDAETMQVLLTFTCQCDSLSLRSSALATNPRR